MYAIYREVHPPTGVEHCTSCHFIHSEKEQVAVASTSLLRIFDVSLWALNRIIMFILFSWLLFRSPSCKEMTVIYVLYMYLICMHALLGKAKLVQCLEFSFYGNIQSLNKVRLRHSDRDSLLLSFNDAKVIINRSVDVF